jgi:hypothetical protein
MRALKLIALALAWPLCVAHAASAQTTTAPPASAQAAPAVTSTYEDHNVADPRPLDVNTVAGSIHDPGKLTFSGALIMIFTELDHTLVASTKSDSNGRFEFAKIKPGLYRLVAKVDALCPANVPLKVTNSPLAHHKIQITMQPQDIDTCSYGTTK